MPTPTPTISIISSTMPTTSLAMPILMVTLMVFIISIIRHINYHIDKCNLSLKCGADVRGQLFTLLDQAGFKTQQDAYAKGNYQRARSMEDATGFGVRLTICYGRGAPFLPRLLMAVHDPTPDFVEVLLNVFSTLGIQPTLSSAEFAFDVAPAEGQLLPLQRCIASTLFLPYQHKHKPAGSYQDLTYYTTNVRTAAKGHRVYRKLIDGQEVIRVELVMGRARLKAMDITLGNLLSTQPQALRQYVQFRSMNLDRLAAYLIRKMGYRDGQPVSTGTRKPHVTQLVRSAWQSALSVDMGNFVMPQYERLRMEQCVKSHGRFLDKHAAFEEEFWEAILINHREEES